MNRVAAAAALARQAHRGQKYGEKPYTAHLEEVVAICEKYAETKSTGPLREILSELAWLHDSVEDTTLTAEEICEAFGLFTMYCVLLLTDPPGLPRKERKAISHEKLKAVRDNEPMCVALIVKAADRLANIRSCVRDNAKDMLEMYRKEHAAFRDAVHRAGTNTVLFDEMEQLLEF